MSALDGIRQRAERFTAPDNQLAIQPLDRRHLLAAVDAVLAIAERLESSNQCEDREIAADIRAAVNDALEASR